MKALEVIWMLYMDGCSIRLKLGEVESKVYKAREMERPENKL